MNWFNRKAAWGEPTALFRKRMEKAVRPFLASGQLDDYNFEDEAWTVVGTRAVLWADRDQDPFSPMRHVPKFQLIVDLDEGSTIVDEGHDIAALIQKAKAEYPEIPEGGTPPAAPQAAPQEPSGVPWG